ERARHRVGGGRRSPHDDERARGLDRERRAAQGALELGLAGRRRGELGELGLRNEVTAGGLGEAQLAQMPGQRRLRDHDAALAEETMELGLGAYGAAPG